MSVRKALATGVSRATSSSARLRVAASSLYLARSSCRATKLEKARPPSLSAFMVSSMRRTSGCTMIGSAALSLATAPVGARLWMRSRAYSTAFW
ncbi:hypothetical protein D3C81_1499360 [compost metagenome]